MTILGRRNLQCVSILCGTLLLTATPAAPADGDAADAAMGNIQPDAIRAHMRFLSSDLLEGRGTATRGYQIAAEYMATQFEALGLKPAGDAGSYFQKVPLRSMHADPKASTFTLSRTGSTESLAAEKDFLPTSDPGRQDSSVEAPVVFVGFGVTAPEQGYDDYKGVDVKGKIVAMLYGAPDFASSLKAHYSSRDVKLQNAAKHGAVGTLTLWTPTLEQSYAFSKVVRDSANPRFTWLDRQGKPSRYFPELKANAALSIAGAEKLLAGSKHTAQEMFAASKTGKLSSFDLPISASLHVVTHSKDVHSVNIAAILEGSDSALKSEYVVYSSHLDHLGIGPAVRGDKIYNGALDNASGSATILEIARAFSGMNPKPRRSLLFVSVTAEEAGLLGSDYFATYPTVPKSSIVADVNVDEVQMLWPLHDIIAFGAEHSSLENVVEHAAKRMNLSVSPDPMPQEVVFIRSDQYSFVKQGIPAVMPSPGFKSDDPNINPAAIFRKWEEERYHEPQDDMQQPGLDFNAAAQFARYAFLCGYLISEDTQRPTWNKGDFFGERYGK